LYIDCTSPRHAVYPGVKCEFPRGRDLKLILNILNALLSAGLLRATNLLPTPS